MCAILSNCLYMYHSVAVPEFWGSGRRLCHRGWRGGERGAKKIIERVDD